MAAQLSDALARASLNQRERRVVERLVVQLDEELGGDLRSVWLFGSRARGEADPSEADPDRRSDIDLMVIVDGGERRYGVKVNDLRHEIAWAEGEEPTFFSVFVHDLEWLRDRRQIESFFIQEVDRDKIVLRGGSLEPGGGGGRPSMSPRSEEFIDSARERLAGARDAITAGHPELAVNASYYAMLYAARAALSERDAYAQD